MSMIDWMYTNDVPFDPSHEFANAGDRREENRVGITSSPFMLNYTTNTPLSISIYIGRNTHQDCESFTLGSEPS